MKNVNVKLSTSIKYAYEGALVDAQFIEMSRPTARQIHLTSIIRSIFQSNMMEQTQKMQDFSKVFEAMETIKNEKAEADKKLSAEGKEPTKEKDEMLAPNECVTILYSNQDRVEKLVITFTELLRSGLFKIDGEVPLTKPLIDSIDSDDFDNLLGSFVSNFTYASMIKN